MRHVFHRAHGPGRAYRCACGGRGGSTRHPQVSDNSSRPRPCAPCVPVAPDQHHHLDGDDLRRRPQRARYTVLRGRTTGLRGAHPGGSQRRLWKWRRRLGFLGEPGIRWLYRSLPRCCRRWHRSGHDPCPGPHPRPALRRPLHGSRPLRADGVPRTLEAPGLSRRGDPRRKPRCRGGRHQRRHHPPAHAAPSRRRHCDSQS
mmetsp:Transcript_4680/g.11577  ORF Transcript_4680/g.11577 Transcript_4680/m.11577 type:complete len:201 (-) Transcript_4680:3541-4143(-)